MVGIKENPKKQKQKTKKKQKSNTAIRFGVLQNLLGLFQQKIPRNMTAADFGSVNWRHAEVCYCAC